MAKKKPVKKPVKKVTSKKNKAPQAVGFRNALAKAFPTFSKALAVKPVEGAGNTGQPKKVKPVVPMTPTVNLLPADYTIVRAISSIRRGTTIAGVGILSALGIIFFAQGSVIDIATNTRNAVNAQVAEANLKVETFQETSSLYSILNERKTILSNIDKGRPQYYSALTEIYNSMPAGTQITQVSMTHISFSINGELEGDPTGVLCGPISDPFASETRAVSACVSFSGTAQSRADLSTISNVLAASPYFSNVVISQGASQANSGLITFTGTAAILRDIDPAAIIQNTTPPPASTPEFDTSPIPEGVVVPDGIIYDGTLNRYFTTDRAYEFNPESGIYTDLTTGNRYISTADGKPDIAFGPVNDDNTGEGN
jgi:Tfp pilus assembly protein PilN